MSRDFAFAVPYVAIGIGLWGLESGWSAFLLYHIGIAIVLTATRSWGTALRRYRPRAAPDGTAHGSAPSRVAITLAVAGAVAGLLGAALMRLLWSWYAGPAPELASEMAAVGLSGGRWIGFALYHAFVNGWMEEIYWRGTLAEPRGLVARSDLAYAGYHALVLVRFVHPGPAALSVLLLVAVAAFWRYTVRRTGSLWSATISHLAADGAIMWVVFDITRGAS